MTNIEKSKILSIKLKSLMDYQHILCDSNIAEFEALKKEILELLDDNQKMRFNQIYFYTTTQENDDDLPF